MHAELLHVVTAIANPVRWHSRIKLYRDFERHMLDSGVHLTVVECAYGERPHELAGTPHVQHVPVRASGRNMVWNKESLLNIGVHHNPNAKYFATIDADILFRRGNWAAETVHALQHYPAVQPWSDCYDLGPNGEHLLAHRAFARLFYEGKPLIQGPGAYASTSQFGHPGYAWAWTRSLLDWTGGLIETAALGAADHHMAMGLIGRVDDSVPAAMTAAYKAPLHVWQTRALAQMNGQLSYVAGSIEHMWHGSKEKRAYVNRWAILEKHAFDPTTDLKRNSFGVIELAGNKPGLTHDIDMYFRQRNEDSNTLD